MPKQWNDTDVRLVMYLTWEEYNYLKAKMANTIEVGNNYNETILAKIKEAYEDYNRECIRENILEDEWRGD